MGCNKGTETVCGERRNIARLLIVAALLWLFVTVPIAGCTNGEKTGSISEDSITEDGVETPETEITPIEEGPAPVVGKAEILSHSSYREYGKWKEWLITGRVYEGEFLHIIGEIQNSGTVNIDGFQINPTFYDPGGNIIDPDGPIHLGGSPDLLAPGEKGPFTLVLLDETTSQEATSYKLELRFKDTQRQPLDLNVLNENSYIDSRGGYTILGEIENADGRTIDLVHIYATFYNQHRRVVAVDRTSSMFDRLIPKQRSPFRINIKPDVVNRGLATYSLHTECMLSPTVVYRKLEIVGCSTKIDTYEGFVVEGRIRNNGDQDVEFVRIIGTFYSADGKVITAGYDYIEKEPTNLKVGETGEFKLRTGWFYDEAPPEDIERYNLDFECSVY